MQERGSKKKLFFFLFVLIISIIFLPSGCKKSLKEKGIRMFSPFTKFVDEKTIGIREFFSTLFNIGSVKKENVNLKKEINNLKSDLVHFTEMSLENERLKTLLGLKTTLEKYDLIAANVISHDPSNWDRSIIINKGFRDGIQRKDPVVSYGGVVGFVYECFRKQSKIMLLNNSNSRVGVIVQRTRDLGIVEGQSSELLVLKYVPRTATITPGDILISSGMGQIYPKGIKVGEIIKVYEEKFSLYKYAEVKPDVNFGKLEEVLVISRSSIPENEEAEIESEESQDSASEKPEKEE